MLSFSNNNLKGKGFPWPVTRDELDAEVKKLQDQIDNLKLDLSKSKSEIETSVKELHNELIATNSKLLNMEADFDGKVKYLQEQITSIINAQSPIYKVGDTVLGGTIIHITTNSKHGLVMGNEDILKFNAVNKRYSWFDVRNHVNDPENYIETSASNYYDWRLPTAKELMDECSRKGNTLTPGASYWTSDIDEGGQVILGDKAYFMVNRVNVITAGNCSVHVYTSSIPNYGDTVYVRPVRQF